MRTVIPGTTPFSPARTRATLGLAAALLAALCCGPAAATTYEGDAGGAEAFGDYLNGNYVYVGDVVVERADNMNAISLGRTNGEGIPDDVPDDAVDHDVYIEIYPQAVGNGCELTYSNDAWVTEATLTMSYLGPDGNNDVFAETIPGSYFGEDGQVQFYFECTGPLPNNDDFVVYVPGSFINFLWNVIGGCEDQDGDGYGAPGDPSCPEGEVDDCDDSDPDVNPGEVEVFDGVDNDCDGFADNGVLPADALVISEVMQNPDAVDDSVGEWFEVYNNTAVELNLEGLWVHDLGSDDFIVTGDLFVGAGDYVVFGNEDNPADNGGATVQYEYSGFTLGNTDDEIYLDHDGTVIDFIEWDGGPAWPDPTGASMSLEPDELTGDNNLGENWCEGREVFGDADLGSPAEENPVCCEDLDGDGYLDDECGGEDCDDDDPDVNPGATEVCDGVDNDCDGLGTVYTTDTNEAPDTTATLLDAVRGGRWLVAEDTVLEAFEIYMDVPEGEDVHFLLYESGLEETDYVLVEEAYVTSEAAGFDWLSSGPMAYPMTATMYYVMAVYVGSSVDLQFQSQAANPAVHSFGAHLAAIGQDQVGGTAPEDGDGFVGIPSAAMYMRIYTDNEPDEDGDGHLGCDECDDDDPAINPDADEVCDGEDNDCDGTVDQGAIDEATWYEDGDGDGYGDPQVSQTACDQPQGYVANDDDCDDDDDAQYPGVAELCNGEDDDCDGTVDEEPIDGTIWYGDGDGDGFGDPGDNQEACDQPDGYVANDDDCDDDDGAINPDADEVCDNEDNDCDGTVDEDDAVDATTWYEDGDGDGYGDPQVSQTACDQPQGYVANDDDCDDDDDAQYPGVAELCNGEDDDCDGTVDEEPIDGTIWYGDGDGDGFGDPGDNQEACDQPDGYVANDDDCDDADGAINPDADELCDGVDNDCDGTVDEDDAVDALTWYADTDHDGYGDPNVTDVDCYQPVDYVDNDDDCDDVHDDIYPGADEYCDGEDDDCDGQIDEDGAVDEATWYEDADGDTYGNADVTDLACDEPEGFTDNDLDCDDTDADVYPGAAEVYDGVDQDCDGEVDEGELPAGALIVTEIMQNPDAVNDDVGEWFEVFNTTGVDINLLGLEVGDAGTDSFVVDESVWVAAGEHAVLGCEGDDQLNGGVTYDYVYPSDFQLGNGEDEIYLDHGGVTLDEVEYLGADPWPDPTGQSMSLDPLAYDAVDNDDGANWCPTHDLPAYELPAGDFGTPGELNPDCCLDMDGDGYDDLDCGGDDCDDDDPAVNPGAAEVCDGLDQDCDGVADDGFDQDGDGFTTCGGDCDDGDAAVNPVATDLCNGIDDDCNGVIDDGYDQDGDGYTTCAGDCDDYDPALNPGAAELCNGNDTD